MHPLSSIIHANSGAGYINISTSSGYSIIQTNANVESGWKTILLTGSAVAGLVTCGFIYFMSEPSEKKSNPDDSVARTAKKPPEQIKKIDWKSIVGAVALSITVLAGLILLFKKYSSGASVIGSGKLKTLELDLKGHTINSVEFSSFGKLSIRNGVSNHLTTTAEDNIIDNLISRIENNKLILSFKNNVNLQTTKGVEYILNIPNYIHNIDLIGSGSISIDQVKVEQFSANISGSGNLNVMLLEAKNFFGRMSGSGNIQVISGKAAEQTVNISGSGNYKAANFIVDKVNMMISGSGGALVNAIESLSVKIVGSGGCQYKGNPSITKTILGSGELKKM